MKMSARQRRRKALDTLILKLEVIAYAEQDYLHSIPTTPLNGERYLEAKQTVSLLQSALSSLYQAYMPMEQIYSREYFDCEEAMFDVYF